MSTILDRLAKRLVLRRLQGLEEGVLEVCEGAETHSFGQAAGENELTATIWVHDSRFYRALMLGGSLGAAEAYIAGWWTASDLPVAIRVFARNMAAADELEKGSARLSSWFARGFHWLARNTRRGSRTNIAAHYDLGNEFFALWLDPTMSYSSAVFPHPDASLEEASLHKLERVCALLDLRPGDELLEIGTGWGGLALFAAQNYGCRVTTTTISRRQHEEAARRIKAAGLDDRVTLLLDDYRDLEGQYDKIVSIEMIEAVGHEFLPAYFGKCSELLRPDGLMVLQAITMPDHRYEDYRRSTDFIQRYVFPGSCCPSVSAMCSAVARSSDMRLAHLQDFGTHYARTLLLWRERFFDNLSEVRALGYPEELIRMWDYYLSYCAGGFAERYISVDHLLLTKPRCRREHVLPTVDALGEPEGMAVPLEAVRL